MKAPPPLVVALNAMVRRAEVTQEELAQRVQRSQPQVSRVLRGACDLTVVGLIRFAAALGHNVTITFQPDPEPRHFRVVVRKRTRARR